MATRTWTRPAQTAAKRSSAFKAKCEANQALVDIIGDKREKISQSSNFSYTLRKAMDSLCKSKEAITTYDQALQLNGIGPSIASLLFNKDIPVKKSSSARSRKTAKNGEGAVSAPTTLPNDGKQSAPRSKSAAAASSKASSPIVRPPQRQQLQSLLQAKEEPSRKEAAYQKACKEAENWKGKNLTWKLVLLIDGRERKAEHYSSKVQQCGIPTEIRHLPIGDMTWIAQGCASGSSSNSVQAELMLGTIIERKEVSDLKSSLFGTRYNEQQLRLKESGQPQVIFLVEGDIKRDLYRCPAETLHSVLWNIRIDKNNQVIQTAHMEDTVNTLRRMHRRMLKRTFPTAFFAEALPSFAGPEVGGSAKNNNRRDSFGEPHQHGRRRRRRLDSLHGLVFDEEPVPMAGMDRFVTYKELCAKVERDRESGRRTVGGIHQAMLKQVATISDSKIPAICEIYSTLTHLLQAYEEAGSDDERRTLLQSITLQSDGGSDKRAAAGKRTLGARSAAELFLAYGLSGDTYDSGAENGENAPMPKYTQLVQAAIDNQKQVSQASTQESDDSDNDDLRIAVAASLAEYPPVSESNISSKTKAACADEKYERASKKVKLAAGKPAVNDARRIGGGKRLADVALDSSDDDDNIDLTGFMGTLKGKTGVKGQEIIEIE